MRKSGLIRAYLVVAFTSFSLLLSGQIKDFNKVKWEKEKIAPGLVWKSSHTIIEDTIPQNINLLIVNLRRRNVSILDNPKANITTSKQGASANALAAVNAGFFSIKDGGSVTYIKSGGKISEPDTAKKWSKNINMTGAVMIDYKGHLKIGKAMSNSWFDSQKDLRDILVTGPFLLEKNTKVRMPESSLVITTHPRSAIGVINKHKVILVTVDGRTAEAHGMSLKKLTDLMISLHCRDAVNLDGGGSSTMWISGKPFSGVVNMPCDNKKFDHEGERAVSNVFIIK